jgi:Ca-activated chloride channel family protein
MINLTDLHFLRPAWLLALIPLGILLVWLIRHAHQSNPWKSACDPHLLPHLLVYQEKYTRHWPWILIGLAWLLAVLALAGPAWSHLPQNIYRTQLAKIIVLDLSRAMLAADIPPNRYTRARYKILDILKHSTEGQIGLIVFAEEPYVVSPLTQDAKTIEAMIPALEPDIMPRQGNNIGAALQKAGDLFQQTGTGEGEILLITTSTPTAADNNIAMILQKKGYKISVLGIGTAEGAPIPTEKSFSQTAGSQLNLAKLNKPALQKLAQEGGGEYLDFQKTSEDIEAWLTNIDRNQKMTDAKKTDDTMPVWKDEGRWLIFPLLFIALIAFRRGWITK